MQDGIFIDSGAHRIIYGLLEGDATFPHDLFEQALDIGIESNRRSHSSR